MDLILKYLPLLFFCTGIIITIVGYCIIIKRGNDLNKITETIDQLEEIIYDKLHKRLSKKIDLLEEKLAPSNNE